MSSAILNLTEDDLPAFAASFAADLHGGEIICLSGPLGAGKTTLMHHIADALGVQEGEVVCSPTFAIRNEYQAGRLQLIHMDFYRLERSEDIEQLDLWSGTAEANTLTFVEWGDKFAEASRFTRRIHLDYCPNQPALRKITIDVRAAHG